MKPIIECLDYLFLTRLTLFYPIWIFFLAGYFGGHQIGEVFVFAVRTFPFANLVSLTSVMGSVFILNQIQDIETDKENGKLFLLADNIISKQSAMIEAVLLVMLGLVSGFFINFIFFLILLALFIFSGWLYNFPPFYCKNRPIAGLICNGMGGILLYYSGWLSAGNFHFPARVVCYFAAGVAVFLNTTLPDIRGDRKTEKITFGVYYGVKKTAVASFVLEMIAIILAFCFKEWILFVPAVIVFPFFLNGLIKRDEKSLTQATKYSVLALALSVCVVYPLFLVPVFIVFYLTKWYYKKRFNFDYPSFKKS